MKLEHNLSNSVIRISTGSLESSSIPLSPNVVNDSSKKEEPQCASSRTIVFFYYGWLSLQGRLATVDRLHKWGIQVAEECVLCMSDDMETLSHLFFTCTYSHRIWASSPHWIGENRSILPWVKTVVSSQFSYLTKSPNCRKQ